MCVEGAKSGILHVEIACAWIGLTLMWNCIPGCAFLVAVEPGSPFLSLGRVLLDNPACYKRCKSLLALCKGRVCLSIHVPRRGT